MTGCGWRGGSVGRDRVRVEGGSVGCDRVRVEGRVSVVTREGVMTE